MRSCAIDIRQSQIGLYRRSTTLFTGKTLIYERFRRDDLPGFRKRNEVHCRLHRGAGQSFARLIGRNKLHDTPDFVRLSARQLACLCQRCVRRQRPDLRVNSHKGRDFPTGRDRIARGYPQLYVCMQAVGRAISALPVATSDVFLHGVFTTNRPMKHGTAGCAMPGKRFDTFGVTRLNRASSLGTTEYFAVCRY